MERFATVRGQAALLFLIVVLCFLPALANGFVWDDTFDIVRSDRLRSWGSLLEVFRHPALWAADLPQGPIGTYRPLATASFVLDYKLYGGLRPSGYHLTSVVLHGLTQVLVFLLLRRLLGAPWPAFALALLGALHPLNVEAVVWVNGRSEVLALLFGAAALRLSADGFARAGRAAAVGALLFLSLLGKETGAIFAPLCLWLAWIPHGPGAPGEPPRPWRSLLPLALASLVGVALYAALRTLALGSSAVPPALLFSRALGVLPAILIRALQAVALPLDQTIAVLAQWLRELGAAERAAYAAAALALLAVLVWLHLRGRRLIFFGLLWWFAALLPITGLVLRDWPGLYRWLYVGLPGLLLAAYSALAGRLSRRGLAALLALLLAGWLLLLERAIPVWRSDGRLFLAMIREEPRHYYPYRSLGFVMLSAERYNEALVLLTQADRLGAEPESTSYGLSIALAHVGRCEDARRLFRFEEHPRFLQLRYLQAQGACHQQNGQREEARRFYQRCAAELGACAAALAR